ncbi:substrate-binding domain-containing protein [Urechidicola vernalis]|uniref:Substrate-binding domain-containing protein n=1 Tax=Urechidicola vernalis TaxID=3075600 RepID=A0ABU2Y591_9FLAO|nr:substrate-binding domain-containing protein [Urechidicola sp. P050]MDT0552238.1 substrate-binding domain-containing protein [Urechidicola sp. P050]
MTELTIGGVPEHFNLPWHLAIDNNEFTKEGVSLNWRDFPGGTGAMCKGLRDGSLDIAVLLTEGIIKDITNGNKSKIVQTYVNSPLLWGVHVAAESNYFDMSDLTGKIAAISRYDSGSHLLAIVNAKNNGWDTNKMEFEVVQNLNGGIDALTNGAADYFLWEHFTTKPLVDNGTFRRIENCPSPWPCFVIAVRNEVLEQEPDAIEKVLRVINNGLKKLSTFAKKERYIDLFAQQYNLEREDVKNWLIITEWNQGKPISRSLIKSIQNKLFDLNVIESSIDIDKLVKKIYL